MTKTFFDKHPDLVVKQENPFNAAPHPSLLTRSHVTPTDLFFVRSHGDVPDVDAGSYRLEVNGGVLKTLSLSLDEIQNNFERVTVSATLQCAGNRREELMAVQPIPHELPWGVDAIGHAVWAGVRLPIKGCQISILGAKRVFIRIWNLEDSMKPNASVNGSILAVLFRLRRD